MEKAILLTKIEKLAYWQPEYSRLYFGTEFCQQLLPAPQELKSALEFAGGKKLGFTLVTPFVTEAGMENLIPLLQLYRELAPPDSEIVINDWGVLTFLHREKFPNPLLLGRLLTKQKRGPQLLKLKTKIPPKALEHFKRVPADSPPLTEFLRESGIQRLELDNLLQGIIREAGGLKASLYYPYGYITVTRLCLFAGWGKRPLRAIVPCKRECLAFKARLTHPAMPVPLLLAGNAQFYENPQLPDNLYQLGIDRLVFQPEVPAG